MKTLTTIFTMGALALSLTACEDNKPSPPTTPTAEAKATALADAKKEPAKKKKVTSEQFAESVKACWAAYDAGDAKKMKACYAPTFTQTAVDFMPPAEIKTVDAVIERQKMMKAAFSDLHHALGVVLVNGTNALVLASAHGTNDGELMGKPATKKTLAQPFAEFIEGNDAGQATRIEAFVDQGMFSAQMGWMPAEHAGRYRTEWDAKSWGNTKVIIAKNDATEKANLEVAKKFHAAFNAHAVDKVTELYADDVMFRYVPEAKDVTGKDAVSKALDDYYKMTSDVKAKVAWSWAAGEYVVTRANISGTNDGAFPGGGPAEPTNKKFSLDELEVLKIADGKIKEQWVFQNTMKFAVQLGLAPDPATVAKKDEPKAKDKPAAAEPPKKDAAPKK